MTIFILLQGLVDFMGKCQTIYFGWKYQWCHWSFGENGKLKAFVGYGKQMLQCLISHFALFNFQIKGYDGNGELISHIVVATNELSHSCLIGS
jgi:hypothetical protein